MLKTKLLYQWNAGNPGEPIQNLNSTLKVNKKGIVYFIQIVSTKPLDVLSEKQVSNF